MTDPDLVLVNQALDEMEQKLKRISKMVYALIVILAENENLGRSSERLRPRM